MWEQGEAKKSEPILAVHSDDMVDGNAVIRKGRITFSIIFVHARESTLCANHVK